MGRRDCYKRDVYHVGKHSRPTPRRSITYCYFCGARPKQPN